MQYTFLQYKYLFQTKKINKIVEFKLEFICAFYYLNFNLLFSSLESQARMKVTPADYNVYCFINSDKAHINFDKEIIFNK